MGAPLTTTEMSQVRTYLGYADTLIQQNAWVDATMRALSSDACDQVRARLAELNDPSTGIDALLATARKKNLAVTEIEGIRVNGAQQIRELNREGRRLCNVIAAILGIEILGSPYGSGGSGWFAG